MQMESKHEQYLRILESGPAGEQDYKAVKYLKDKGYTDSPIQISYGKDSYLKPINVVWIGPNSNGLDYIDELRARAKIDQSELLDNDKTDGNPDPVRPQITKESRQSHLVSLAFSVLGMLVFAALVFLFREHFGISL